MFGLDNFILKTYMEKTILGISFERLIVRLNVVASCIHVMIPRLFYKSVMEAHRAVCCIVSQIKCLINSYLENVLI